jgi:hypothetical protein
MGGTDGILTKLTEIFKLEPNTFYCDPLPITTPTKSNLTITPIWGGIGGVHYIPYPNN